MAVRRRTTISIPPGLKARMDEHGQDVNWSAVACRAFEHELAGIISKKGPKDMKDVIARVRASKETADQREQKAGFQTGESWAKSHAEYTQFQALASLYGSTGNEWDAWFDDDGESSAYTAAQRLYFILFPEDDRARHAAKDFWEGVVDDVDGDPDGAFVRGFAEGVLNVWHTIEEEV